MKNSYLYDAVRTPRGKAKSDGGLATFSPQGLVKHQLDALRQRAGHGVSTPDALLLGCVGQVGAQGGHIALVSKLHSGLPDGTAAHSINNYCASGLSAIGQAAALVESGQAGSVLAGGVEMMSRVPFMGDRASYYDDASFPHRARYIPVVLAADRLANAERLDRAALDAVALASQQKAGAAENDPVLQRSRIATDTLSGEECIRPATTADTLAAMEPAFGALQAQYSDALGGATFDPLHSVSHAPPVCDGAGLALVGGPDLTPHPRARILAFAESGGDPEASLTAGFSAMEKVLARAGLTLADIDRIEFMEAFAVTIAKFLRDYSVDPDRVNVGGGHIAKGHPMGASGAILASTLLDCLDACDGNLGLVVVSGASGVGAAMIVERLN
ncbi:MAG: acetyl-CoA C-acyltransferase [Pseudomonadota bacterium]